MTQKKLGSILKGRIEKTLATVENAISHWQNVSDQATTEAEKEAIENDIYKLYAIKTTLENLLDDSVWRKIR